MTPERRQQLNELFDAAPAHTPRDRAAFLEEAGDGEKSLRKQREGLGAAQAGPEKSGVHIRGTSTN